MGKGILDLKISMVLPLNYREKIKYRLPFQSNPIKNSYYCTRNKNFITVRYKFFKNSFFSSAVN